MFFCGTIEALGDSMGIIRKLWLGMYPLPRTFWGFYVFGFFGIWIVVGIPAALLASFFPSFRPLFLFAGMATIWTYWGVASMGVWRSANDSKHYIAFWRYAARAVILLYAFIFVRNIMQAFAVH